MPLTVVRALWGDIEVSSWPKALRDIQTGGEWRKPVGNCQTLYLTYGVQNTKWLRYWGLEPHQLSEEGICDLQGKGNRYDGGRRCGGTINFGITMWCHKADAIVQAFEQFGATEVLWLDWDTIIRPERAAVLDTLKGGPVFQGRLRGYKNARPPLGSTTVWHGGCYYCRDPEIFRRLRDDPIPRNRWVDRKINDECILFDLTNKLYFDGKASRMRRYRLGGYDNPWLYSTRINVLTDNEFIKPAPDGPSMFQEGPIVRSPCFTHAHILEQELVSGAGSCQQQSD